MNIILLITLVLIIILLFIRKKSFFNNIVLNNYQDLLSSNITEYTPGGIPKIIIKTSWQTNLPGNILKIFDDTLKLNNSYKLYYFDDSECEKFLQNFSERALKAYKKIIPGAYKADLFRYCFLYKYGGCYSDIGHVMLKPFDEICGYYNMILIKLLN